MLLLDVNFLSGICFGEYSLLSFFACFLLSLLLAFGWLSGRLWRGFALLGVVHIGSDLVGGLVGDVSACAACGTGCGHCARLFRSLLQALKTSLLKGANYEK